MRPLLRAARSRPIVISALKVSLVVGSVLNLINQSGRLMAGEDLSWMHLLLNYLVPYCVASYSAAKNQISKADNDDRQRGQFPVPGCGPGNSGIDR